MDDVYTRAQHAKRNVGELARAEQGIENILVAHHVQRPMVKVEGQIQTQVKAPILQVTADGMLQLKGGVTMIG